MTRFDWRTEDEDESLSAPARGLSRLNLPGRRLVAVASLGVILLAALGIRHVQQRAAENTSRVEADILASFGLWQGAVAAVDVDLFDTLLVGAEPGWADFQRRLLARGVTLNRPLLGLRLAGPAQSMATSPQVNLSPDWRTAEVVFTVPYRVAASRMAPAAPTDLTDPEPGPPPDAPGSAIALEQRLTFSHQGQLWVLARPPAEYWGDLQTIETDYLTLTFYDADGDFASRFANDLERELAGLAAANCARLNLDVASGRCSSVPYVRLHLAIEPEMWLDSTTLATLPLNDGPRQLLPSPSVIGWPADESSYRFLYRLLAGNLVDSIRTRLAVPVPLPDQTIAVACFPEDRPGQRLFTYDPSDFSWQLIQTDYAFRRFSPLPDDSGLVIEQHISASVSTGLHLRLRTGQSDQLLYDEAGFNRLMTVPFGWSTPAAAPHLLLNRFDAPSQTTRFHLLDRDQCDDGGCAIRDLPGYPVWSPDGRQVILMVEGALYLGPGSELNLTGIEIASQWVSLGPGFSPFWLDDSRFGFARYVEEAGYVAVEVMLATIADPAPWQLLSPEDLTTAAGFEWPDQPVFVNHLFAHPSRPDTVFAGGIIYSPAGGDERDGRQFRLFSVTVPPDAGRPGESLKRLLTLDGVPASYPSMLNASGSVPYSLSPDGRWVLSAQAKGVVPGGWLLYLYDIDRGRLSTHLIGHPSEGFRYPFLDWSADGEWLVVVDDGFLRLLAPAHDYEQRVPLEQPVCGQVAWLDKE